MRDQLENGHCIGLLACPHQHQHGSLEHAQWLFEKCTEGAEVINSAAGFGQLGRSQNASPAEEMRLKLRADTTGADLVLPETMRITPDGALAVLTRLQKERQNDKIYLCTCPFCSSRWLVKDGPGYAVHDCLEMRKILLPGLNAHMEASKALETAEKDSDDLDNQDVSTQKSGVTRCVPPISFEWDMGQRITADNEIFSQEAQKKKGCRRPNRDAPAWERATDGRGHLTVSSLERHRILYPYHLLEFPEAKDLFDEETGEIIPMEGFISATVEDSLKV